MTWGKVSDRLHAHSKARRAREAMALWVLAMSWSCDELTDGAIPADMPELLIPGGDAMAERLVSVGLWERTEAGFRFHDWDQFQPSADLERNRRESVSRIRSEAGKRGAAKRWQTDGKRDGKPIANGWQTDSPVPVPVPEPREEILPSVGPRALEALALAPITEPKAERRTKRVAQPIADVVPAEGTLARKVFDVVTNDRAFAGLVRPGDFAERVCADGAYPGVDVLAQVRAAGAWAAGKPRAPWRDVRAGLLGWLRRAAEEARQSASVTRVTSPSARPVRAPVPVAPAPETPLSSAQISEFRQRLARQRAGLEPIDELPRAAGGES